MANPEHAPCGSWQSPISTSLLTEKSTWFFEAKTDGQHFYWIEARPREKGRYVLVRYDNQGQVEDMLPQNHSARSLVNSYGGGAYTLGQGRLYFSNHAPALKDGPFSALRDQRLHLLQDGHDPRPITDIPGSAYADGCVDEGRQRLLTVRENHQVKQNGQAQQTLIAIDLEGNHPFKTLVSGADFYAAPRLSPDGKKLAYLTWNYPNMPWDSAELHVATFDDAGEIIHTQKIAGGDDEAVVQPEWSKDGQLYFVSDRSNWWNLYVWDGDKSRCILAREAEFSEPLWVLGSCRYALIDTDRILTSYRENGLWNLGILSISNGELETIPLPFTEINQVRVLGDKALFFAAAPDRPSQVVLLDLKSKAFEILRRGLDIDLAPLEGCISHPEPIHFPTTQGAEARAFYYPPHNAKFAAKDGELPPLIVKSHGGPTSSAGTSLDFQIQYFTSRGFAVVDVDYRGSTGYGRDYRLALYQHWGEYDGEDCVAAANYLVKRGDVDADRIVARGGSAGGYITLWLMTFTDLCRAGVSYYGISDLELIVQHADKLEAFYPFKLLGPYPEMKDLYRARSPYFHADQVNAPVAFFQGLEDPVVPPDQTRVMVEILENKKVPVAVQYFEGEQHGFRQAKHIKESLEAELSFYADVLGFEAEAGLHRMDIKNWPQ